MNPEPHESRQDDEKIEAMKEQLALFGLFTFATGLITVKAYSDLKSEGKSIFWFVIAVIAIVLAIYYFLKSQNKSER